MILIVLFIPMVLIFALSETIFLAMGQEPQIAHYASQYAISQLVGLFFAGQFDLTKRFLIQLQVSWVPMMAQVACTLLHFFWCHLFIMQLDFRVYGAGLAMTVTNCL